MGANSTQAVAIVFMLGWLYPAGRRVCGRRHHPRGGALALLGASCFFFMKCKPWENQKEQPG